MSTTTSGRSRATAGLAAGSVVSGLLAYVFFALTTRALGAEAAAPVAVLWSYWGFAAAGLTFPIQHWIARTVAVDGGEAGVAGAWRRVLGLTAALTLGTAGLARLAGESLFGSGQPAFPLLVGLVTAGAALMGWVRGLLTARERFAAVGAVLVAENALRVLVALVLLGTGSEQASAFGWALVGGYAACAAWPAAWLARADGRAGAGPVGFLGGAAGGQVIAQAVLVGGPVLLALLGGTPTQVTALFAGLALYRMPYTLLLGQVAQLTGGLTRLVVAREAERLRRITRTITGGTVLVGLLAAAIGAGLGPWAVRLVFGADVRLGAQVSVVVAVASAVALANLVLGVLLLAHGRTTALATTWAAATLPGLVVVLVGPGDDLRTVSWTFLVVELAAWLGLTAAAWRAALALRAGQGRA